MAVQCHWSFQPPAGGIAHAAIRRLSSLGKRRDKRWQQSGRLGRQRRSELLVWTSGGFWNQWIRCSACHSSFRSSLSTRQSRRRRTSLGRWTSSFCTVWSPQGSYADWRVWVTLWKCLGRKIQGGGVAKRTWRYLDAALNKIKKFCRTGYLTHRAQLSCSL